jgi:hypothetical protein
MTRHVNEESAMQKNLSLSLPRNCVVCVCGGGTYVTRYCGHFWPIVQPQMIDEGDYGAIGGIKIGRGNGSTRR